MWQSPLWHSSSLLHFAPSGFLAWKVGDCSALIAARLFDAATTAICLALVAAKPAIATTATTTSARRVDFGFATSGACGHECVWAISLDDLGLGSRACSSSGMG